MRGDSLHSHISVASDSLGNEGSSDLDDYSNTRSSPNENSTMDTRQPDNHAQTDGTDTSHKRKQSEQDDAGRSTPQQLEGHKRAERQHVTDRALHMLGDNAGSSPSYRHVSDSSQNGQSWKQDAQQQAANNLPTLDPPSGSGERRWAASNATAPAAFQHDTNSPAFPARPRTRIFSHRTRTGCMTCRRRKKKCDEGRPACGNCDKAGHPCEGYGEVRRGSALEPALTKPVPLRTKNGPVNTHDLPRQSINDSPHTAGPHHAYQTRFILLDKHGRAQHATCAAGPIPHEQHNAGALTYLSPLSQGQPWPPQQGQPPSASYTKVDLPPPTDLRRGEDATSSPSQDMRPPTQPTFLPGPYPGISPQQPTFTQPYYRSQSQLQHDPYARLPHTEYPHQNRVTSYDQPLPPLPSSRSHHTHPPSHQSTPSTSGPPSTGSKLFTVEEIERSKMLRRHRYLHLDPTLVWERQRCDAALERYNADLALTSGKSDEEVRNSLWKVLDPSRDALFQGRAPLKEKGVLSHGVVVERGFRCSYGYNLRLMDGVYVDQDVYVDDAAKVEIGARSWVGAGTQILTSAPCSNLVDRKGMANERTAQPVVIESEVQVGAGCVICPGVRLERGCIVRSGTVVNVSVEGNKTFGQI